MSGQLARPGGLIHRGNGSSSRRSGRAPSAQQDQDMYLSCRGPPGPERVSEAVLEGLLGLFLLGGLWPVRLDRRGLLRGDIRPHGPVGPVACCPVVGFVGMKLYPGLAPGHVEGNVPARGPYRAPGVPAGPRRQQPPPQRRTHGHHRPSGGEASRLFTSHLPEPVRDCRRAPPRGLRGRAGPRRACHRPEWCGSSSSGRARERY